LPGLRGIGDPELDHLFAQAEGPHLARIFLISHFNILHAQVPVIGAAASHAPADEVDRATTNARTLARELVKRSISPHSSDEAVFSALKSYAFEEISKFSVPLNDFLPEIEAVCEAVSESYEFVLKLFVADLLLAAPTNV